MTRPSARAIHGALLVVLGCALLVAFARDVPREAREAGQVGVLLAWGALVVLHLGARVARSARRTVA